VRRYRPEAYPMDTESYSEQDDSHNNFMALAKA